MNDLTRRLTGNRYDVGYTVYGRGIFYVPYKTGKGAGQI